MSPDGLAERLTEIETLGLYRRRRVVEKIHGVRLLADGKPVLNFCSNDYLGLADHTKVVAAFMRGAQAYGVGSGASHLVSGHSPPHQALEEELAEFTHRERALLFSTGYMANLGVIAALAGRGEMVFEDRLNHASLLDGALLSAAKLKRYAHADAQALRSLLEESQTKEKLVITDGVFSMDGDLAPLPDLAIVAGQTKAWLMVDDAHGLGVVGPTGRGVVEHFGLSASEVPVLVGTLGKAFGTFGAFVAGSHDLIDYLIQRCRPYIYTTALPPAVAEATRASLALVDGEAWRREKLVRLIEHFRLGAAQLGLNVLPSHTPIQPILLGGNPHALKASQNLLNAGFLVAAIRPPTVPEGTARLRVTLSAAHRQEDVERLLEALGSLDFDLFRMQCC
jgi:8-amino-7-oxononanoate synthase